MAKQCYTNTQFWDDDYIISLDPIEKRPGVGVLLLDPCGGHAVRAGSVRALIARDPGERHDQRRRVVNEVEQVIEPAARIGRGIFLDHATGLVVGETAVIGDNVSMLHDVTLGGTGKQDGDRHPKIGSGVMIGAGAKILGNIEVGECARIAAGSVVLHPVPPCKTVAGVPAKVIGEAGCSEPSRSMDQIGGL